MASKWKTGAWSSKTSYNDGKFRVRVKYKVSNKAFTFGYNVDITDNFNKAQPFFVRWKKDGKWTGWKKSPSKKQKGDFSITKYSLDEETIEMQVAVGSGQAKKVNVPKVSRKSNAIKPTKITADQVNDNHYTLTVSGQAYKTRSTDKLAIQRETDGSGTWENIVGSPFTISKTAKYELTFDDLDTQRNHKYKWRVQAQNIVDGKTHNSGWRYTGEIYSSPATNITLNIDSSEDSNILSWTIDETGLTEINKDIVQGWHLYKSENGGTYNLLADVPAIKEPTTYDYEYEDEEIEPGYSYSYQIKSYGMGGESLQDSKTETEVVTPPTRPSEVKVYRQTNDYVNITVLSNSLNTATEIQIERSIDGEDFVVIATESFSPQLNYIDETAVAEDNIIYRALNRNDNYISEYTTSDMVMIKSKPNPPYLVKPINKSNVNIAIDCIRLEWMHRATDGTPQQDAKLQWRKKSGKSLLGTWVFNDRPIWNDIHLTDNFDFISNGENYTSMIIGDGIGIIVYEFYGDFVIRDDFVIRPVYTIAFPNPMWVKEEYKTIEILTEPTDPEFIEWFKANATKQVQWQEEDIEEDQYFDLPTSGLNSGDVIEWRVKTKGSFNEYSEYSDIDTFTVRSNPQILITSPARDEVISELPIEIEFYYDGMAGNLKELHIDIINNDKVDMTIPVDIETGVGGTYNVVLTDYLFERDTVYGLQVYALAESGLSTNELVSIQVQYENVELDGGYLLSTDIDEDTGIVNVQVDRDVTTDDEDEPPTPIEISRALLYRVHDRERVFLAEVSEGDSFDDLLAPLNCNYMYELQMLTADGQISIVQLEVEQESIYSYIYYGNEIFKAKWNPEFDVSLGRPERKEQRYSGREYATSYDSKAREETCKYSTVLLDREDLNQLKEMMRAGGGHGIWKSADGDSYYANFEVSYQTNRYYAHQEWKVSLSVTRIEGKNGLQQQSI